VPPRLILLDVRPVPAWWRQDVLALGRNQAVLMNREGRKRARWHQLPFNDVGRERGVPESHRLAQMRARFGRQTADM